MKRVLVFGMTENPGGVESFLMNYYRHIDRDKLQFDFLCNTLEKVAYEDELISLGGRVFHIVSRRESRSEFKKELNNLFRNHSREWDAIWVNVCSLANIDYLKIAKKYNIKKRVIHSHNSQNMDGVIRGVMHRVNKKRIKNYATDYWACSTEAARWFFCNNLLTEVVIIHNAIDVQKMEFNKPKRTIIRQQIGANEKTDVVGNVGRLHFQKNQLFALESFAFYHNQNRNSIMVLVGQGEDESDIKKKVEELELQDSVVLAGLQKDVQAWLSSFDLFLFPSLFEGLSVAALEAQANGVPVLASNRVISPDTKVNNNFVQLDLADGAYQWSKAMEKMLRYGREEQSTIEKNFNTSGYNIKKEVIKLEDFFIKKNRLK